MSRCGPQALFGALLLLSCVGCARHLSLEQQCWTAYRPILGALGSWLIAKQADEVALDVYPEKLQQLTEQGYLRELPANPFGTGPIHQLAPGQPDEIGGFRYIPMQTRWKLSDGNAVTETTDYMFVLYTPRQPKLIYEPTCPQRLGSQPMFFERAVQGYRNWPDKTPRIAALEKLVVDSSEETEGQALTRLGYK